MDGSFRVQRIRLLLFTCCCPVSMRAGQSDGVLFGALWSTRKRKVLVRSASGSTETGSEGEDWMERQGMDDLMIVMAKGEASPGPRRTEGTTKRGEMGTRGGRVAAA